MPLGYENYTDKNSDRHKKQKTSEYARKCLRVRSASDYPQLECLYDFIKSSNEWIAGGCFKNLFLGQRPKDLDMFFATNEARQTRMVELALNEYKKAFQSDKSTKMKNDSYSIDIVKSDYLGLEEVLSQFDFTVTKFGMRLNDNGEYEVVFHEDFFQDLIAKKLVCDNDILWPLSTFDRMLRYCRYGYAPCKETKKKLVRAMYDHLKEHDSDVEDTISKEISLGMYNGGID